MKKSRCFLKKEAAAFKIKNTEVNTPVAYTNLKTFISEQNRTEQNRTEQNKSSLNQPSQIVSFRSSVTS